MLKLGIVTIEGLARPHTWFGRQRHASLLLFQQLAEARHQRPDEYDRLVERVRLPNGIWKQTAGGRLADVDDLVLTVLEKTYDRGARLSVLDLAVSTGVTSVSFYQTLRSPFSVDFIASDLYRDAFVVRSPRWRWATILDHFGAELQYVIGPFVLPGQLSESPVYPVNRFLKLFARIVLTARARPALECLPHRDLPYFEPHRIGEYEVLRLPLISYGCLDLMEHDDNFKFEVIDILQPIPHRATVVRAMNIITPDHLDVPRARLALGNCAEAAKPGGLLITGRSVGLSAGTSRVTVYRVGQSTVTPIARLNGGCEMEGLTRDLRIGQSANTLHGELGAA